MVNGEWNAYEEEERKRGSPSVRSKMEYLLLDYKRQRRGEQMQGAGEGGGPMQDEEGGGRRFAEGERESKIINQEERPTK